ncbi:MAG: hypothetical protein AAF266_10810 [Planctomycetota bacterium]
MIFPGSVARHLLTPLLLAVAYGAAQVAEAAGKTLPERGDPFAPGEQAAVEDEGVEPAAVAAPFSLTTHAEYSEAVFERLQEATTRVYRDTATDEPAVKRDAEEWLTLVARADADLGGAPSWSQLSDQGDELIALGCDHPLVVSYAAHLDLAEGKLQRSRNRHDAVSAALLEGEYGSLARFYEAFRLMRLETLWGTDGPRRHSERASREAWIDLATEQSLEPVDQRQLWCDLEYLAGQSWDRRGMAEFVLEAGDNAEISPWLQAMIAGKAAYDRAWEARGGSYANDVDEDRWKPFHDGISEARGHFERAYEIDPTLPEAPTQLVKVANADQDADRDDLRYWFDEARSAQVDYLPAYTALLWSMRPRWHGSHGAMYALANEWYAEGRFDTNIPYMSAQAVFDIGSEVGGLEKAFKPEPAYVLTMSAFEQMADDPAHDVSARRSYARPFLMTNQIAVAIRGGREADARQVLDKMLEEGTPVDDATMRTYDLAPEIQIPRLLARTGAAAETVKALNDLTWNEKRADRDALQRTVDAYQSAKELTDDPRTDDYFHHWLRVYSMERNWHDGKWATPRFGSRHLDWYHPVEGLWEIESEYSAIARRSDTTGVPWMWTECYLAGPYEVEVEVEPLFETGQWAMTGVHAGGRGEGKHGLHFWINKTLGRAGISETARCEDSKVIGDRTTYKLSARVWPEYAELWIDDELIAAKNDPDFAPSGYFALATVPKTWHAAEVRYRNPRFRRLEPREEGSQANDGTASDVSDDR